MRPRRPRGVLAAPAGAALGAWLLGLAGAGLAAAALAAPPGMSAAGGAAAAARPAGSAEARLAPKPTAPIAITHRASGEPRAGEPYELVVIVTAKADLKNGIAHLSADEGMILLSPAAEVWLPNLTVEATHEIAVTVQPLVDRKLYLNVAVSGQIGGRFQGRSVGIAIRTGDAASNTTAPVIKTDEDGQRLRALPAQESFR